MIKLSDYVIDFVAKLGVKHVFLLPGGGCMHLVDSLGKNKKLEYICNLHEQASAVGADAYAQYTGNIGVALVTTGPGSTNAITGVAASWIESTPVLILSGQVKRADLIGKSGVRQMGIQEVDIVPIVKPVTKYAVTVMDPCSIRYHLEKAVYLAKTGRPGPVWVTLPLDIQGAMIDENKLRRFIRPKGKAKVDKRIINKVIGLINAAERPVILAGNGIRLSGAKKSFLRLIEKLNMPVLTTWRADDLLPEGHRLYFGRPGVVGQRGANFIQQNADLIITIGARLDFGQIGFDHKNFAREAKKVIVDVDPSEIKKLRTRIEVPVVFDARVFIDELLKNIKMVKRSDRSRWIKRCVDWKNKYPVVLPEYYNKSKFIDTYVFIDVLSDLLRGTDLLVPGSSGSSAEITQQAIRVKKGLRILNTPGLGSMGFGLPASIGACLAGGRKRTIAIVGDGGLQHNLQELEVLARLKLPVKLFVLNNNGYASIRQTHNRYFAGHLVCCDPSSGLTLPDTCKVAAAYGIKTERIYNHRELKKKMQKVLNASGPVICDLMIDPAQETLPRVSSQARPDGSMVSKPLEDLYPFLDRGEFRSNMIVKPLEE
jgi:acetolactate synthase-1/2/3 large subunit